MYDTVVLEEAEKYPECLSIVRDKVKPEREKVRSRNTIGARRADLWWRYDAQAKDLYKAIRGIDYVWVTPEVSKYIAVTQAPTTFVYSHKLIVFPTCTFAFFSVVFSSVHRAWIDAYSGTLGNVTINYSIADGFETFPFPDEEMLQRVQRGHHWNNKVLQQLDAVGEECFSCRQAVMAARNEGLTKTYNRVNDPSDTHEDIRALRSLHVRMDNAVAKAYGWTDLSLNHGFYPTKTGIRYTIEDSVKQDILIRLLMLNQTRYAEQLPSKLDKSVQTPSGKRKQPKQFYPDGSRLFD